MTITRTVLFVALLLGTTSAGRTEDAAPKSSAVDAADEFADKITLVYLDAQMRTPSWVLSDVAVKEVGGRMFLIGVGVDTQREGDWRVGKRTRISWPLVTGYMLFTAEQYAKHVKESRPEE